MMHSMNPTGSRTADHIITLQLEICIWLGDVAIVDLVRDGIGKRVGQGVTPCRTATDRSSKLS